MPVLVEGCENVRRNIVYDIMCHSVRGILTSGLWDYEEAKYQATVVFRFSCSQKRMYVYLIIEDYEEAKYEVKFSKVGSFVFLHGVLNSELRI